MSEEVTAKKSDSTIIYFLVGLGLGSFISALFAPKSGDETRKYLSDKLKEGSEYTRKKAYELKNELRRQLSTAGIRSLRRRSKLQRQSTLGEMSISRR